MIIDYTNPAFHLLRCFDADGNSIQITALDLSSQIGFFLGSAVPVLSYHFDMETPEDAALVEKHIPSLFHKKTKKVEGLSLELDVK